MNSQEHFNHSLAALTKAYFNNALTHGSCTACAVGTLIAASRPELVKIQGAKWEVPKTGEIVLAMHWYDAVRGYATNEDASFGLGLAQIAWTGYSLDDITRIEAAFEFRGISDSEHQRIYQEVSDAEYEGLMAVVDVLADIHGVDLSATAAAKLLFVKANA